MKRFILFMALANLSLFAFAQSNFFYSPDGSKVNFKVRNDKVILKTAEAAKISTLSGIKSTEKIHGDWVIATIDTVKIRLDNVSVANAVHLLEYEDGTLQAPTQTVFVKCKERHTVEELFSKAGLAGKVREKELINEKEMIYALSLDENEGEVMRICRELYETGLCEFAEPSFLRLNILHNTFFSSQWGLRNTGQYGGTYGMDINVLPAWEMTRGNNVRVAVVDEGVEPNHPDLQANIVNGFDATTGGVGNNWAPGDMDFHGTACAGIIGGMDNTIGIVGVAPNCVIVPIRTLVEGKANDMITTNGINLAWSRANADVISCSWGMGSPSATVTAEINRATTEGRGGRGCVVVASSGNKNQSSVGFPASLSNVLAVGAMSPCGERKSPSSCDGEAWGSNYGDALNVVAPGVLVATTDRVGTNGYNTRRPLHLENGGTKITADFNDRDYTVWFGGTSAACPHVAGVAALVLSANPNLTQLQVRNYIESTCDKLSGYMYTSKPNGPWHREIGYGKINAHNAVAAAVPWKISGPTLVGTAGKTFNITNTSGRTVTWSCSSNLQLVSGGNTSAVFRSAYDGKGWIRATVNGISTPAYYVWSGKPVINRLTGPSSAQEGEWVKFVAEYDELSQARNFQWQINPASAGSIYGGGHTADMIFYNEGSYQVVARATNDNGTGEYCSSGLRVTAPWSYSYTYYLSQASDVLYINMNSKTDNLESAIKSGSDSKQSQAYTGIYLYNQQGTLLRKAQTTGKTVEFDVSNLPGGFYYLHVKEPGNTEINKHQILIKR